jgi:hypothetical protein
MGLVAKAPQVFLDANVVVGLVLDATARAYVADLRRNGCRIYLSPAVVRELATAPTHKRQRLLRAAMEHCDGFSDFQAAEVLRYEVEAIAKGEAMRPIPLRSISNLQQLMSDHGARSVLGKLDAHDKSEDIGVLLAMASDLKDPRIRSELNEPFERFLRIWLRQLFGALIDAGVESGAISRDALRGAPQGTRMHNDKKGLAGCMAILAANMYRQARRLSKKGEGCLSDLPILVEVSQADIFLTRDVELYECAQLARSGLADFKPDVRFVPLS